MRLSGLARQPAQLEMSSSNESSAVFEPLRARRALDVARAQGLLRDPAALRAQAADYDAIAESESVLDWSGRVRLATAAAALRLAATLAEKQGA
jgi:hypothetical protein